MKSLTGAAAIQAEEVNLVLKPANQSASKLQSRKTIVTDKLNIQLNIAPRSENIQVWKHLSDIDFPQVDLEEILVLIGADNPDAFVTEEVRPGGQQEPWGFKYSLGWTLLGPTTIDSSNDVRVHLLQEQEQVCLQEQLNRFFQEDGIGVVTSTQKSMSFKGINALKVMEDRTLVVDGHYELPMLWKVENPTLPIIVKWRSSD